MTTAEASWVDAFGSWWGPDPDRRTTTDIDVALQLSYSASRKAPVCRSQSDS